MPESELEQKNQFLLFKVEEAFLRSKQSYGYRRVFIDLKSEGVDCYRNQICKIMSNKGLQARGRVKYKVTTKSNHNMQKAPNVLKRQFAWEEKNRAWVSDITYIWSKYGLMYLSTIIDLHSRKVVAYALDNRMTKRLVTEPLQRAIQTRKPEEGLIFHSDQGSQYASNECKNVLSSIGAIQSMSRKGNCWDNAVAESFFKTIKTELIRWENFQSRDECELKIFQYIEIFYNRQRRHSSLGYLSPVEFEEKNLS